MLKLMALPTRTTGVSSCLNTSQLFLIQLVHFESAALSRAKRTHKHAHTDTHTHASTRNFEWASRKHMSNQTPTWTQKRRYTNVGYTHKQRNEKNPNYTL